MGSEQGQVIFRSSRELRVLVGDEEWRCDLRGLLRRSRTNVVVGDLVRVRPNGPGRGVVEGVLPRRSWLSRRREVGGGRELVVAANIDQLVAVFAAARPRLKFGALDRLLVAAEHRSLDVVILLNKIDLGVDDPLEARIASYARIGYPVLRASVRQSTGMDEIHARVLGRVSVVAGPSGVGKSSLLSSLLGIPIRVGEVSDRNEKGRHITTAATWYPLPKGGALVDTPGFRDYGLWDLPAAQLASHMPDVARLGERCRFRNCSHREEPECAVRDAVENGTIERHRYRSYLAIRESLEAGS